MTVGALGLRPQKLPEQEPVTITVAEGLKHEQLDSSRSWHKLNLLANKADWPPQKSDSEAAASLERSGGSNYRWITCLRAAPKLLSDMVVAKMSKAHNLTHVQSTGGNR